MTQDQFIGWLQRFGYLAQGNQDPAAVIDAVKRMQRVYGLRVTGQPNAATLSASRLFRCSQQDTGLTEADTDGTATADALASTINQDCRWQKTQVTYGIDDSFNVIGGDAYKGIIRKGFAYYASLCGITFAEADSPAIADIKIVASSSTAAGMDGPGNVLAISNLPWKSKALPLLSTFDSEEAWTANAAGPGVVFQAVFMHELGHLLGLSHSANPNDIMSPFYTPDILYPQRGDKQRLALLYNIPFIETSDVRGPLDVGAYTIDGIMVVRHDGGIALNLKNIAPAT